MANLETSMSMVSYHIGHNTHKPNSYSHYNLLILLPHFSGANDGSIQSSDKAAVQKTGRYQANYVLFLLLLPDKLFVAFRRCFAYLTVASCLNNDC